ncbi:hypothetical protein FHG66_17090 [Rubellimicrobium rubrum]|uniref:LysR substrate-binding domain-containing protein n=1 Tax=Rubellimicrobium rubrum TaxID=2585369 RepID=A0A5C4MU48_9RHOB|nr:LysR substrate-binding domain-containing protein [Rubellimicrobium rubrum]TNC47307.1 hypothetical protein FHG66_17090 [Rubellimicrobium rubrum]
MSRLVREFTASLEVGQFTPCARRLDPTAAALGLVDNAKVKEVPAKTLNLKVRGRSHQLFGILKIAAFVMVGSLRLPVLADLRPPKPSIQIEFVASDATQNLLGRAADIAICIADPTQYALIARKVRDTPMGLFATRGYFDRRGRVFSRKDLGGHEPSGSIEVIS